MTDPVKYSTHGKSRSMYTLYCRILDLQDCSRSFTVTYKLVIHKLCYCIGNGARQTHGDHHRSDMLTVELYLQWSST